MHLRIVHSPIRKFSVVFVSLGCDAIYFRNLESMCEQKLSTPRMMQNYVVTGGYDKTVRLWDARTGALLRTFIGHNSAVSRVIFNPLGNLVISGSKDYTIKFWDLVSGVCVKTYSSHFGGAVIFFNFQLTLSDGYQYMSFHGYYSWWC
jgi:WD40 repeat protein